MVLHKLDRSFLKSRKIIFFSFISVVKYKVKVAVRHHHLLHHLEVTHFSLTSFSKSKFMFYFSKRFNLTLKTSFQEAAKKLLNFGGQFNETQESKARPGRGGRAV